MNELSLNFSLKRSTQSQDLTVCPNTALLPPITNTQTSFSNQAQLRLHKNGNLIKLTGCWSHFKTKQSLSSTKKEREIKYQIR